MKNIAIVGYKGKMGSLIFLFLKEKFDVVGVGKEDSLDNYSGIDLVIDFASHESSLISAEYCLKNKIPIIIGATGQTKDEEMRLNQIAQKIKVVKKANFSRGIEVLKNSLNAIIAGNPNSIEIIEKHHVNKKDAPSGTALEIKEYIEHICNKKVAITSIREGLEMGEHIVKAYFNDETISLKHNVYSRNAFVLDQ